MGHLHNETNDKVNKYIVGGHTPHEKRKILCLGMSYADMDKYVHSLVTPPDANGPMAIRRVIECVRRDYLSEMDGRDLARVVATEYDSNADLYTVSQEAGANYRNDRHMNGNFNRTNFVRRMQEHFLCLEFDQVVLDYFWIPAGWDVQHWTRTLFGHTLIELARHDVLPYRAPREGELLGSVILPFCYHSFKEVIGNFKQLRRYYDVSFLRKHELHKVPLWKGTQQVGAKPMQYWLGKRRDQEEVYCTFGPKDVNEAGKDTTVSKQKIVNLAKQLEDFSEIRFMVLTRLPPPVKGEPRPKGKWCGLTPKEHVRRGYDALPSTRQLPLPPHQEDDCLVLKREVEENARLPFKKRKFSVFFQTSKINTTTKLSKSRRQTSPKTVLLEPGTGTGTIPASLSFENQYQGV